MNILLAVLLAANITAPPNQPILGFTDCSPALFRQLPKDQVAVSISKISYDSFGRVFGFREDFQSTATAPSESVVTVVHDPSGSCPKMKYTVEVAGHQLASKTEADFKTIGLEGSFAFTAKDIGGIVVIGSLEGGLETGLSYDSFGRRQLAKQGFTYAGHHYEVIYSNVTFDSFGRLSSYQAVLKMAVAK